jgi:hypothetical protein
MKKIFALLSAATVMTILFTGCAGHLTATTQPAHTTNPPPVETTAPVRGHMPGYQAPRHMLPHRGILPGIHNNMQPRTGTHNNTLPNDGILRDGRHNALPHDTARDGLRDGLLPRNNAPDGVIRDGLPNDGLSRDNTVHNNRDGIVNDGRLQRMPRLPGLLTRDKLIPQPR